MSTELKKYCLEEYTTPHITSNSVFSGNVLAMLLTYFTTEGLQNTVVIIKAYIILNKICKFLCLAFFPNTLYTVL